MNILDMRTVLLSYMISSFICTIFILELWLQSRRWFDGIGFWVARFVLQWIGVVLIVLRGRIPDFYSSVVSSILIAAGQIMLLIGMERFLKKPGRHIHNFILLVLYFLVYFYFTNITYNLDARSLFLAASIFIFSGQTAWLALRRVGRELAPLTRGVGITSILFCINAVFMIVYNMMVPINNDIMQTDSSGTFTILITQMLSLMLSFNLFSMVSHRLMDDLYSDIARRKQVEETLRDSEEKFHKAFHSSPDAISITRLVDGQFMEVNDGFIRMFGITRQEALNSSAIELGMWKNLADRDQMVKDVRQNRQVHNQAVDFRHRSGQTIHCLYSGDLISLNGETYLLSTIRDITEKVQSEKLMQLRLDLWEYALNHSQETVMQKALDEIGELTESPIGFYHMIEEDQNTLTMKAWSTRMREDYGTIDREAAHFLIHEAGVWSDCIKQRKPVIYNDNTLLGDQQGFPAGLSPLIREMIVPVLFENQVVAILGIGNKATDYTERDVELVSYIADVTWTIVNHHNAIDKIQELNTRLEHMVMVDALTGIYNRRAFFERGEIEIKRACRYQTNLSLIMLDIDYFKQVNDTYGHDCGDAALQTVAKTLQANIREVDILARLGGEEFAVLLPNTAVGDALKLGERIRQAVAQCDVILDGNSGARTLQVTVSVGVAAFLSDLNLDGLLRLADQAMYKAKQLGRNRVVG